MFRNATNIISETLAGELLGTVDVAVVATDPAGRIAYWNRAAEVTYGWVASDAVGRSIADLAPASPLASVVSTASATKPVAMRSGEFELTRQDGTRFPARVSVTPVFGCEGRLAALVEVASDITAQTATETRRLSAERAFQIGFERAALGVGMTDMNENFTDANPALCEFFGRSEAELLGHSPYEFLDPDDAERIADSVIELMTGLRETLVFEARFARPDGTLVWGLVNLSLVIDDQGEPEYVFGQVENITARKRAEEALEYQALHDGLTGLPNRALLSDRLEQALARRDVLCPLAVLFIDLDEFKVINDGMGHDVGDRVLVEVARRLASLVRDADTVGRFGGDEFVVLSEQTTVDEARLVAHRLLTEICKPIHVSDLELAVTASIGITLAEPGATSCDLLRAADTAMYRAKQRGRARVEVFTDAMGRQATNRLEHALALRRALEHDELSVAYQPVVNIQDGSVAGVEALIRWKVPHRGWVDPDDFIPVAEQTGQIFEIGDFVMHTALRDVQRIRSEIPGGAATTVAVNLSARQFNDPALPGDIAVALRQAELPVEALHLEITETSVMDDVDAALPILTQLRDLGLHIDVDDFGTGYSSLNYLKRLPVTTLKIDRSFVDGLGTDPNDSAIVSAIVALAHALGLATIAEGVETTAQLDELRRLGCEYGQGHLWARGLSAEELASWMTARTCAPSRARAA